jgi:hypothetical protein
VRKGHTTSATYEVTVQGGLEPRWATWFAGFTLTAGPDGTTVITGTGVDQAALHGLLQSLRDLGLPLLSVEQLRDGLTPSPAPDQRAGSAQPFPTVFAQEESP